MEGVSEKRYCGRVPLRMATMLFDPLPRAPTRFTSRGASRLPPFFDFQKQKQKTGRPWLAGADAG